MNFRERMNTLPRQSAFVSGGTGVALTIVSYLISRQENSLKEFAIATMIGIVFASLLLWWASRIEATNAATTKGAMAGKIAGLVGAMVMILLVAIMNVTVDNYMLWLMAICGPICIWFAVPVYQYGYTSNKPK
jgi:uncharacterized membrane protein